MVSKNEIVAFLKDGNRVAEWFSFVVLAGVLLFAATGAFAQSGNVYGDRGSQTVSTVTRAVVLQSRIVKVAAESPTRYAGAGAGAALGGAIGASLGTHSYAAQTALGLVGAALGGVAGNNAADTLGGTRAVEFIVQVVRPDSSLGETLAITQPDPADVIGTGELVYLINTAGTWRVVRMQSASAPRPETTLPMGDVQRTNPGVLMVDVQGSGRY